MYMAIIYVQLFIYLIIYIYYIPVISPKKCWTKFELPQILPQIRLQCRQGGPVGGQQPNLRLARARQATVISDPPKEQRSSPNLWHYHELPSGNLT